MIRLTALTAALALGATATTAQQNCAPRDVVLDRLAERFGESRQFIALAPDNRVIETFAAPDAGTWTITITLPNGMTCVVAAGTGFERLEEPPKPTGTKS